MSDKLPDAALAVAAVLAVLVTLANAYPEVDWLRRFRFPGSGLTEEQRKRIRRRSSVLAGVELIGLGLILPLGYPLLTAMTFNDIDPGVMTLLGAGSVLCIGLGVWALFKG